METSASPASTSGKNAWIWVIAAVVVIGIIIALTTINKDKGESSEATDSDNATTTESVEEASDTKAPAIVAVNDPDMSLRYTAAIQKYSGRRIAFDSRCLATPARATYPAGTKIMLDNRGSVATRIVVGDSAFEIPAYNFSFMTLSEVAGSSQTIDCGSVKAAAIVTVAK